MLLLRVISPCKLLFQNSRANLKLSCFSFYLALLYSSPLSHRFPPTPNSHLKTPYIPPILYSWYNNLQPLPRQRILSRIVQRKCRRASIDIILKIITLKKKSSLPTSTHLICNSFELPDIYSSLLCFPLILLTSLAISCVFPSPETIPGTIFIFLLSLFKSLPSFLCLLHTQGMGSLLLSELLFLLTFLILSKLLASLIFTIFT